MTNNSNGAFATIDLEHLNKVVGGESYTSTDGGPFRSPQVGTEGRGGNISGGDRMRRAEGNANGGMTGGNRDGR